MDPRFGDLASLNPDEVIKELRSWSDNAAAVQEKLNDVTGTATSKDGYITVTFTPQDGLRDLEINPRAMRMASSDLAAAIKEAIREATRDMQQNLQNAMSASRGSEGIQEMLKDPSKIAENAKKSQEMFDKTMKDALSGLEDLRRQLKL
ncbi:YbaB/EbfC family nucleoid-associated protein [Spirillospora sp. CA-253888]